MMAQDVMRAFMAAIVAMARFESKANS